MSEIRAVLSGDQTIKAILNSDSTVKAVLVSGVTVNQKIDGGEYVHFDVSTTANNQMFTANALAQYIANTNINLFKNGVYVPPVDFIKIGDTTIQINIPLATGDSLDILATGSAALPGISNSAPGGINQQLQFNNSGLLDGATGATYNVFTQTTSISTANVNVLNANTANIGTLSIANFSLPNVTSNNANFTSLTVTGQSNLQNVSVSGSLSVSGTFSPASVTTTTVSASNVGTGNLIVSNVSTLGPVSNVKITGGTNGYVLQTDGTGNLSWTAQTGGGGGNGAPGGSTTQVQFNDGGVFAGDSGLTYAKATDTLTVTGNVVGGNIRTNNLQYSNGSPYQFTTNAAGSNTQVQFNDGNVFGSSTNFTFNKNTNTLSATNISGTLTTANQPNITGLGTLGNLSVSGTITGTIANANYASFAGNIITANQPNITGLGTLGNLTVSGNITAGNVTATLSGSATGIYNIPAANISGTVPNATFATSAGSAGSAGSATTALSASTAGTVTGNSQGNITSIGTLSALNVSGVGAVTTVRTDNLQYANGANWVFSTYSNSNVATYLPTYTGLLAPGNIQITNGSIRSVQEPVGLTNSSPTSTQTLDLATNTVNYFLQNTAQNTTLNLRGSASTTLNSYMAIGQSVTLSVILTNPSTVGSPTYSITGLNIDGTAQTVRWVGGLPGGSLGGLDIYVFTVIKYANGLYTVIASKGNAQ